MLIDKCTFSLARSTPNSHGGIVARENNYEYIRGTTYYTHVAPPRARALATLELLRISADQSDSILGSVGGPAGAGNLRARLKL